MPTISQRKNGKFRAQIRLARHPKIEMDFDTHEQALVWSNDYESRLKGTQPAEILRTGTVAYTAGLYFKSPTHLSKKLNTRLRELDSFQAIDRLLGHLAMEGLSHFEIQVKFFDKRQLETFRDKPISGNTIRLEKALLSQLYKYAIVRNLVTHNPVTGSKYEVPRCESRDVRIPREVQIRLYAAAIAHCVYYHDMSKRRNHAPNLSGYYWLQFMFETAMRPGEASRIKLEWIDLDYQFIRIPVIGNKNNATRLLLVNMIKDLPEWVKAAEDVGSPYLFYSHSGNGYGPDLHPYNYSSIWKEIKPLVKGLDPKATPHGIRHEVISRLVESTSLSLPEIALLVGMKSYDSLKAYIHLRMDTIQGRSDEFRLAELERIQSHPEMQRVKEDQSYW